MKQSIGVILLTLLITVTVFFSVCSVKKATAEITDLLQSSMLAMEKGEQKNAIALLEQTNKQWQKHRKVLQFFVDQDTLDGVDNELVALIPLLEHHPDDVIPATMRCLELVEEIKKQEGIGI